MNVVSYEVHEDSCQVCGERPPAMVRVQDRWMTPPEPGSHVVGWRRSAFHFFCLGHARQSVSIDLEGRILTTSQQAEQHEDTMRRFRERAVPAPIPDNIVAQQIAALEGWALGCQDIERRKAGAAS